MSWWYKPKKTKKRAEDMELVIKSDITPTLSLELTRELVPTVQEKNALAKVQEFIYNHPEIITKGIPLAVAVYILFPVFVTAWAWLPWIWASYQIYTTLPPGTIPISTKALQLYLRR